MVKQNIGGLLFDVISPSSYEFKDKEHHFNITYTPISKWCVVGIQRIYVKKKRKYMWEWFCHSEISSLEEVVKGFEVKRRPDWPDIPSKEKID